MANLVSMRIPRKGPEAPIETAANEVGEEYPYGLQLDLGKEVLEKLGDQIDSLTAGSFVRLSCVAKVKDIHIHDSDNSDYNGSSVCLQITKLAIDGEAESEGPKRTIRTLKASLRD